MKTKKSIISLTKYIGYIFHTPRALTSLVNGLPDHEKNNIFSNVSVNVKETEEYHQIQLSAPGFKKENFKIEVDDDNSLTISNEFDEDISKERWVVREFRKSSFYRSFVLPDGLNINQIEVTYEDGILFINIPKK